MNKSTLFYGGIVLAVIFVLISVYYITPNHYHVLASPPQDAHLKHAVLFFILAIISLLVGLSNRNTTPKEN